MSSKAKSHRVAHEAVVNYYYESFVSARKTWKSFELNVENMSIRLPLFFFLLRCNIEEGKRENDYGSKQSKQK